LKLIKRLPTKEAESFKETKREEIKDILTDQEFGHKEFGSNYFNWKVQDEKTAFAESQIDDEVDFLEDPENFEKGYYGRMSPFAKEHIYREYHKGMSIKDLSLKYGILH